MFSLKDAVQHLASKAGYRIVKDVGHSLKPDCLRIFGNDARPIVFDVGASRGQTVVRFKSMFPGCEIHSFEPSPSTFKLLQERAAEFDGVHCHNLALGGTCETREFLENAQSDVASFLEPGPYGSG